MKRWLCLLAVVGSFGCASVETATVSANEVTTPAGDAVAVMQASALGFTFFFHLVDIVNSDLDVSVLVSVRVSFLAGSSSAKAGAASAKHVVKASAIEVLRMGFLVGSR